MCMLTSLLFIRVLVCVCVCVSEWGVSMDGRVRMYMWGGGEDVLLDMCSVSAVEAGGGGGGGGSCMVMCNWNEMDQS